MRDVREAGMQAALAGRPSYSCPHQVGSAEWNAWMDGWTTGVEMRERMEDRE